MSGPIFTREWWQVALAPPVLNRPRSVHSAIAPAREQSDKAVSTPIVFMVHKDGAETRLHLKCGRRFVICFLVDVGLIGRDQATMTSVDSESWFQSR